MPIARAARAPLFRPYIFTRAEMRRLLRAIESDRRTRAIEPQTLKALVLFLFGSGALIDEAFNLKRGDLDLRCGVITLRRSHSGRVRTIPIGRALCRALAAHARGPLSERLFQSRKGGEIRRINLIRTFQRACVRADIRTEGGKRTTPALHELRNTFAVHCIERWVRTGTEIHKMMPVLSGYMGHVEPRSTEQYLRFVPSRFVEPLSNLAEPKPPTRLRKRLRLYSSVNTNREMP